MLSRSSNIYKEIREYLKRDQVEVSHVEDLIQQALALPENRGQVSNAFQHIWGYFKKQATAEEKADFMLLLEGTSMAKPSKKISSWESRLSLSVTRIATYKARRY